MSTEIEKNQEKVLKCLVENDERLKDNVYVEGKELSEATGLEPNQLNDAIELLHSNGLVDWIRTLGTVPYKFHSVKISARGKYEYQRRIALDRAELALPTAETTTMNLVESYLKELQKHPRSPVGSPYGFTYYEWEVVSKRKANKKGLYVALGCKFDSKYHDVNELEKNVESMFKSAIDRYNKENPGENITLEFLPLHAGYGTHLFNKIAQDIMSSDIAVFETSDLAPNVFIEMGVALTYGSRVFPIKREGCVSPPSDISGHTYADYRDNAKTFLNPKHEEDVFYMVEQAIRTKG